LNTVLYLFEIRAINNYSELHGIQPSVPIGYYESRIKIAVFPIPRTKSYAALIGETKPSNSTEI